MPGSPTVKLRVPDEQRERWQAAADQAGMALSEFIREAVELRIASPTVTITNEMFVAPKFEPGGRSGVEITTEGGPAVVPHAKPKLKLHAVEGGKVFKGPDPKPDPKAKPNLRKK